MFYPIFNKFLINNRIFFIMNKWHYTCRSCLSTAESFSYFIFKDITAETYLFCTSVEVKRDQLPKSLCGSCYQLLNKFKEFKKTCIQSENKLLRLAKNFLVKNEPCADFISQVTDVKLEEVDALENDDYKECTGTDESHTDFGEDVDTHNVETEKSTSTPDKVTEKSPRALKQKKSYNFKCEKCHRKFAFKERLEGHMLKHEGKTATIQCKSCNKTFKQWGGLRSHIESAHSRPSFKEVTCPVCCKVFKTPSTLRAHQRTHQERRVRVCDECGRTFKSDVTFKNHLETHVKDRQRNFTCEHCGKKYISKKTCAKHVYRRHTDRQFICHYCQYIFKDKANLIRHIMLHEGTHPKYKCDVCSRLLTSQASLTVHKRIHSGEKPYVCGHCGKRFSDRGVLVEHERVHTGERPFACVICSLRFARRGSMRRHMKVHKT